jgi:hypothetical protein
MPHLRSLSDAARSAVLPILGPTERMARVVPGVGCTLVLTDRNLMLVRDGASFRPRTGVQAWPLDRALHLRLGPLRRTTSRLVIEHAGRSASVFLTTDHMSDAESLIAEVRRKIYSER